jgi:hypothetical protein
MIAIVDPGKPTPWWWAKAMPPLGQYFSRQPDPGEPIDSPSRGQPELATRRFPRRRAVTSEPV